MSSVRTALFGLGLAGCLFLGGCAMFAERPKPKLYSGPRDQVYSATYDEVWKAVNLVLQPYPLRVSNMDQGVLETDSLRADKIWVLPFHVGTDAPSGQNYRLVVRVIRGAENRTRATKVMIIKEILLQSDFFSDPKNVQSDGLEEKTILYRISREVQIERALARSQLRTNQKQQKAN